MSDFQFWLTLIGFFFVNIVGWWMTQRSVSAAKERNAGAETQKDIARDIRVDGLPCQVDPTYLVKQGQQMQKLEDIQLRLCRMEQKMDDKR